MLRLGIQHLIPMAMALRASPLFMSQVIEQVQPVRTSGFTTRVWVVSTAWM